MSFSDNNSLLSNSGSRVMKSLESRRLQLTLKLPTGSDEQLKSRPNTLNASDHMSVGAMTLRHASNDHSHHNKLVTSVSSNRLTHGTNTLPLRSKPKSALARHDTAQSLYRRNGGDAAFISSQSVRRLSHRILQGNAASAPPSSYTRAFSSKAYTDYTRCSKTDIKLSALPTRSFHIQLPGVFIKNAKRGSLKPVTSHLSFPKDNLTRSSAQASFRGQTSDHGDVDELQRSRCLPRINDDQLIFTKSTPILHP